MARKWFVSFLAAMILLACASEEHKAFVNDELAWRKERDQRMQEKDSWLTIAGLYWLSEGENPFGTAADNAVVLPAGSAPEQAGIFFLKDGKVHVVGKTDLLTFEGTPVKNRILKSDGEGRPDELALNDLRMWAIRRGDRMAIRLRDFNAAPYKEYHGLNFFPPREPYRIKGVFEPFDPPTQIEVATVVGTTEQMLASGQVRFTLGGEEQILIGFGSPGGKSLFIVFRDGTSGNETYGASRFLYAAILEDGSVDLNFNRAINPPCAYTKYATCPLPPPENILNVPIKAGEKTYSH